MLTLLLSLQVKGENEPHSRHGFAGTPCYMSPEVDIISFLNKSRVKSILPTYLLYNDLSIHYHHRWLRVFHTERK